MYTHQNFALINYNLANIHFQNLSSFQFFLENYQGDKFSINSQKSNLYVKMFYLKELSNVVVNNSCYFFQIFSESYL